VSSVTQTGQPYGALEMEATLMLLKTKFIFGRKEVTTPVLPDSSSVGMAWQLVMRLQRADRCVIGARTGSASLTDSDLYSAASS
jgi:hypothetical protein